MSFLISGHNQLINHWRFSNNTVCESSLLTLYALQWGAWTCFLVPLITFIKPSTLIELSWVSHFYRKLFFFLIIFKIFDSLNVFSFYEHPFLKQVTHYLLSPLSLNIVRFKQFTHVISFFEKGNKVSSMMLHIIRQNIMRNCVVKKVLDTILFYIRWRLELWHFLFV